MIGNGCARTRRPKSKDASTRATARSLRQVKVQSDGLVGRLIRHGLEREAIALELLLPLVRLEAVGTSVVVDDDRLSELGDTGGTRMYLQRSLAEVAVNDDLVADEHDRFGQCDFFRVLGHVRVSPGDGRQVARRMDSI